MENFYHIVRFMFFYGYNYTCGDHGKIWSAKAIDAFEGCSFRLNAFMGLDFF